MQKKQICRWTVYIGGLLSLALGLVLNAKSSLGVAPIMSMAYAASEIFGPRLGDATFIMYIGLVSVEIGIHITLTKGEKRKVTIVKDLLQLLMGFCFTRFVNIFSDFFPAVDELFPGKYYMRILVLLLSIVLTGIGAAMSLDVRLVPIPGDGIVQALSDLFRKKVGFMKNCFDVTCVCITCIFSYALTGKISAVGVGTLLAVILVGRTVALFNHLFLEKIEGLIPGQKGTNT